MSFDVRSNEFARRLSLWRIQYPWRVRQRKRNIRVMQGPLDLLKLLPMHRHFVLQTFWDHSRKLGLDLFFDDLVDRVQDTGLNYRVPVSIVRRYEGARHTDDPQTFDDLALQHVLEKHFARSSARLEVE